MAQLASGAQWAGERASRSRGKEKGAEREAGAIPHSDWVASLATVRLSDWAALAAKIYAVSKQKCNIGKCIWLH